MAAQYDFQRRPNPKGDGELQPLYPRIVNKGTIDTERLVSDISHAQTIFFSKVHFRVSPDFRKRCAGFVERAKYGFRKSAELSGAERYRRLLVFLETHPFITRKDYSSVTGLLKNKALNDLNLLVEKGYLSTIGQGSHKVYVRAEPQEVKSGNP